MRTVTNCFVLNLAAADLLFAITIPTVAYTRIVAVWKLGNIACKIIPYIQVRTVAVIIHRSQENFCGQIASQIYVYTLFGKLLRKPFVRENF